MSYKFHIDVDLKHFQAKFEPLETQSCGLYNSAIGRNEG